MLHHALGYLALCITQPRAAPPQQGTDSNVLPVGKAPTSNIAGIHLKFLLYNQVIHFSTLELYISFGQDTNNQFLCKVLLTAIIDGFLSHHTFYSMIDIVHIKYTEPHSVHQKKSTACEEIIAHVRSTFMQGCEEFNKKFHTSRDVQNEAIVLQVTSINWIKKCACMLHVVIFHVVNIMLGNS